MGNGHLHRNSVDYFGERGPGFPAGILKITKHQNGWGRLVIGSLLLEE
jgi:hypothetical protein